MSRAAQRSLLLMTNSVAMGGMEEHVRLLARGVDRAAYRVHAAVPDWEPVEPFAASMRAAADAFTLCTPDRRHGTLRQGTEAIRLWRLARRERFDVVHLHSTSYGGLTAAVLILRLAGARSIVITEHLAPERPVSALARWRRRALNRMTAAVVCVSENNRLSRERFLGVAPCRTRVVNNGVEFGRFATPPPESRLAALRRDLGIPPGALVVGTAIRLEDDKGVDDLIDAFAAVHRERPSSLLLVVGDGSQRTALEQRAARLGLADAVRFVGFASDPRDHIRLMDVFVLPVPFGSASIGLLEAMAMRRACVITFGGDKEAVQHGETGCTAEPRNPASLAAEIARLLDDHELRDRLAANAAEAVRRDYSAERVALELTAIYDEVSR